MKAYIGNVDWADEGDVFFFSTEDEERLKAMRELIGIYSELDLLPHRIEMYWGTNESFDFSAEDLNGFIDNAVEVSDEEIAVFNKFKVSGFDIFYRMSEVLQEAIVEWDYTSEKIVPVVSLTPEELDRVKPAYVTAFGQEAWDDTVECFDNSAE